MGSHLYVSHFTKVFELTEQMQQQGQSELDVKFATALTHLRQGSIEQDDWQFLQRRVFTQLPAEEQVSFSQAVNLYATKKGCP
jgi:hypothetical protein